MSSALSRAPRVSFAFFLIAAVVCATLALTGCGKSNSATAPTGTAAASPEEVRIGYFANLTHAQAVLAMAAGDFERAVYPSKVSGKVFNAGPSLMQALNAGQIDVGYVGPGPVLSTWNASHGEGVRVIAGACADGVVIVARKDSGISSLRDLAGKKVATPELGNTQDIAAKHYVKFNLQADVNNVITVRNSEQAGQMSRGNIDAAWVPEPWGARLMAETGATLVGEEKEIWPSHTVGLTFVVTTPEFLAKHADVVEKLLRVHHQWTLKLQQSPGDYVAPLGDALAKLAGAKLPEAVLKDGLSRTRFTDDANLDTFQTNATWSHDVGFIAKVPALDGLIDTTIIKKAQ